MKVSKDVTLLTFLTLCDAELKSMESLKTQQREAAANFAALYPATEKCAALGLPKAQSVKLERVTAEQIRSNGSTSAKQQEVLRLSYEH